MDKNSVMVNMLGKAGGVLVLVISGVFAFVQYKDIQEREFKRPFYERQIQVVNEVFEVLSEVDTASTEEEKNKAVAKFWMIYHGKSRTFLDTKMFEALQLPAEYVASCIDKIRPSTTINDCSNFTASMSSLGFAKAAREQLSLGWKMSFSEIGKEDPVLRH